MNFFVSSRATVIQGSNSTSLSSDFGNNLLAHQKFICGLWICLQTESSAEDYLERIHELLESKGTAHVADIAQSLGVEHRVSSMVQKLAMRGIFITRNTGRSR